MKNNSLTRKLKSVFVETRTILLVLVIFTIMGSFKPFFATYSNVSNIFSNIALEGVIAVGMTFVIIIREIDLSVGANMGFCCVFAVLMQPYGIALAIVVPIMIGLLVGYINGFFVTRYRLPSMGVTLAMQAILMGVTLALTSRRTIRGSSDAFRQIALHDILGLPAMAWIFIACVIIFELILLRTSYGRNIYACGGNLLASEYSGINVDRTRLMAFVIVGGLCGIAGILAAAKYNAAGAIIGTDTVFYILTAVMLGGTSLAGGEGKITRTFQGMIFVGTIDSCLNFLGATSGYRNWVVGTILIIMLVIDSISIRRNKFK